MPAKASPRQGFCPFFRLGRKKGRSIHHFGSCAERKKGKKGRIRGRTRKEKTHSPLLFSLRTPLHFPLLCARWNASRSCAIHSRNLSSQPTTLSTGNRNAIVRDTAAFSGKFNKFLFFFPASSSIRTRARVPSNVDVIFFPFFFFLFSFYERESFVQAFCRGVDLKRSLIVF